MSMLNSCHGDVAASCLSLHQVYVPRPLIVVMRLTMIASAGLEDPGFIRTLPAEEWRARTYMRYSTAIRCYWSARRRLAWRAVYQLLSLPSVNLISLSNSFSNHCSHVVDVDVKISRLEIVASHFHTRLQKLCVYFDACAISSMIIVVSCVIAIVLQLLTYQSNYVTLQQPGRFGMRNPALLAGFNIRQPTAQLNDPSTNLSSVCGCVFTLAPSVELKSGLSGFPAACRLRGFLSELHAGFYL